MVYETDPLSMVWSGLSCVYAFSTWPSHVNTRKNILISSTM